MFIKKKKSQSYSQIFHIFVADMTICFATK
jgi:hypothetical protein